jgi:hypothetical protein
MSSSTFEKLYTGGAYLEKNPLWHTEESSWKAENVMRMVNRHKISKLFLGKETQHWRATIIARKA